MKGDIDSRESPAEGSVDADFAINPLYRALGMIRPDHPCMKSTHETIKARLEQ
jgi:hypothetical protein